MKEVKGIVTAVKRSPIPVNNLYTILTDSGAIRTRCELSLEVLDSVAYDPDSVTSDIIGIKSIKITGKATRREYEGLLKKRLAESSADPKVITQLKKPTGKMLKRLRQAAQRLMRSYLTGSPITVRFHNDCDGSSGAVALYRALAKINGELSLDERGVTWRMNKSIAYQKEDANGDLLYFNGHASTELPLVLITDFGTAQDSEDSIKLLWGKADIIWLEHHPIYEGFPREKIAYYINPWDFGGDSDYTAGYLTGVFSELVREADVEDLKQASLIGDHSAYAQRRDGDPNKIAIVLDYLTSKKSVSENLTPHGIDAIIGDREKLNETYQYASTVMSEAIENGIKKIEHHKTRSGINLFVLDFKEVAELSGEDYPLPGRYSSRLQEKMEEQNGGRTMTMVHYGNYVSVRVGREVTDEVSLLKTMDELKKDHPDHVYSCGGHNSAGSLRSDKEHMPRVVKLMLAALLLK